MLEEKRQHRLSMVLIGNKGIESSDGLGLSALRIPSIAFEIIGYATLRIPLIPMSRTRT